VGRNSPVVVKVIFQRVSWTNEGKELWHLDTHGGESRTKYSPHGRNDV